MVGGCREKGQGEVVDEPDKVLVDGDGDGLVVVDNLDQYQGVYDGDEDGTEEESAADGKTE